VLHDDDVGQGVAQDGDDVGVAAGGEGADVLILFNHGSGLDGGGLERTERSHVGADDSAKLLGSQPLLRPVSMSCWKQ
jgi:hypothetical protein